MRPVALLLPLLLTACTPFATSFNVPLDTLPAGSPLAEVRADLVASASRDYGPAAVERAMAAPTWLIAKRFAGMAPPPPPGNPDWRPPIPVALLFRDESGWQAAGAGGWRRVDARTSATLDALIASARFRNESAIVPACPDFGAQNLMLKLPGAPPAVRNAMCVSAAGEVVNSALGA